ncbi:MAG: PD-(D/E)XK nuclease family protein, partial [Bacillota bacterium]
DGLPLRRLAMSENEPDMPMAADPSRWQVFAWNPADCMPVMEEAPADPSELMARVRELAPVEAGAGCAETVDRYLSWLYPYMNIVGKPAKAAVTEVKRRFAGEDDGGPEGAARVKALTARPRFLQETTGLTAAEKGSAMHLVMQHLDLAGDLTAEGIKNQLAGMLARELLTAEQAAVIDTAAIAGFFACAVGRRVLKAAAFKDAAVKRELPFTMAVPAGQIYPDIPADTGDKVLVQGVIDCLIDEEDGLVLIDYKTDRVTPETIAGLTAGYRGQMNLYARAVEMVLNRPVRERYLYLFATGDVIPV